jgi:hypothetical protein
MPLYKLSFAIPFNILDTGFWMPEIESSGISLSGTKNDQRVLNLAITDGGCAQSLFVGSKTA